MDSIGNIFFRIGGIRVMDVVVTIISAVILSYAFKVPVYITLPLLFILGVILHRVFGIRTTIDKWLFK
jgi:hypothetical protein